MPFFFAKASHLVGALGLGMGFQRGSGVSACEGRVSKSPSGVDWMGQAVRSWLRSICAPSRAIVCRVGFVLVVRLARRVDVGGRGFGS